MEPEVEYLAGCLGRRRWRKGTLVRRWKDGTASIRTETTGRKGWLVVLPGDWRFKR